MGINANKSVAVRLSLNSTQFLSGINTSQKSMRRFANNVKTMATGIVTSLGLIGGYVGKQLIDEFVSFEFEMAKVKATTGATGKEFDKLLDSAQLLGRTTQFTAQDVADLQFRLSKLGFKTDDINNMTSSMLDLSLALGEDLGQTTTTVAQTMRIFGIESSKVNTITDQLAGAFTNSGLNLESFGEALKYVGPVAASSGSTLNDMTAYLGVLANNGIEASIAGTSLRKMFSNAAKTGRNLNDMLTQINESTNKNKTAFELFGRTAMSSAVILAKSGWEVGRLGAIMETSAGKTEAMRKIMDSTARGALKRLTSAFSGLSITAGSGLMNALKPAILWLTELANTIDVRIISAIMAFIGILVGGAGLILVLGSVIKAVTLLGKGFGLLTGIVWKSVKSIALAMKSMIVSMGPVGWAITAIVVAIAAIGTALANNSETVKKWVLDFINGFINLYNESTAFRVSVELIIFAFKMLWINAKTTFNNIIDGFGAVGEAIWLALQGKFGEAKDSLVDGWNDIVSNAEEAAIEIAQAYKDGIDAVENNQMELWVMEDLDNAIDTVKRKGKELVGAVKNYVKGGIEGILSNFSSGTAIGPDWAEVLYGGQVDQGGDGISQADNERLLNSTPLGFEMPKENKLFSTENQILVGDWLKTWGTAVQAVQDLFGSMFESINQGYEDQLVQIGRVADAQVEAVSNEHISEADKAKKVKKIREKQAKDEADIKLKQWKANKMASLSNIAISGAMAIAKAFAQTGIGGFVSGPLVAAAVGAQLAVAASQKPPKFADGGIVSGRTLAEVGEYSGVKSNPEVIAPLDKLKNLMGGSAQVIYITGEFRQSGTDLVAVIDETQQRQNRY